MRAVRLADGVAFQKLVGDLALLWSKSATRRFLADISDPYLPPRNLGRKPVVAEANKGNRLNLFHEPMR